MFFAITLATIISIAKSSNLRDWHNAFPGAASICQWKGFNVKQEEPDSCFEHSKYSPITAIGGHSVLNGENEQITFQMPASQRSIMINRLATPTSEYTVYEVQTKRSKANY